ncbi:DNA mismatch repair protein MutT [Neptunitalea chrysea]|uniref:DNA mismatch repair protein MutT n=1 Tax=Neptunitalea chrysea TaxID=1647581 RepID=A0A9W6EWU0_9FLAO|nr:NUDIX domain-containing protein [Neptunitalea chrysea]GLB53633.1 DNA mismatch repair protein MutT [Neptunitalea chrysea]
MEEFVDILDAQGLKTGQTCSKKLAHRYGYIHGTVHIWFYTIAKELLLQKRAITKEAFPGLWDTSVAGHISAGETILEAAVREVEEEIGLSIEPSSLRNIGVSQQRVEHSSDFIDAEFNHLFICALTIPIEKLQRQIEEVDELKLISITNFQQQLTNQEALKLYVPHTLAYYEHIINTISSI